MQPPGYACRSCTTSRGGAATALDKPKPDVAVCVVIENGGHGGTAAAPAALQVFEHFFHEQAPPIGTIYSD